MGCFLPVWAKQTRSHAVSPLQSIHIRIRYSTVSVWVSVALRSECNSLVAHLSAVAESRFRILAPCKYCKEVAAAATSLATAAASAASTAAAVSSKAAA